MGRQGEEGRVGGQGEEGRAGWLNQFRVTFQHKNGSATKIPNYNWQNTHNCCAKVVEGKIGCKVTNEL